MRSPISVCLLFLSVAPAVAQDDQSTLAMLLERADAVAVARAVRVDTSDAAVLRVVLAVEERLRGDLPATVQLSETRGRGCGRALTAVVAGQRFLTCLVRRADGLALVAGGARALPLASGSVLAHARALLAATEASSRLHVLSVLIGALTAPDDRVRTDAALCLPMQANLEQADSAQRAALVAALASALQDNDRAVPNLTAVAVRLHLVAALDLLLPLYLAGDSGVFERLFVDGLVRLDGEALATRIAAIIPALDGPLPRARATTLLLELKTPAALGPLRTLAERALERGTRLRACAGLLRLGIEPRELATIADQELIELAQRAAQPPKPRFRSIRTE